jgi:hypothetical protein
MEKEENESQKAMNVLAKTFMGSRFTAGASPPGKLSSVLAPA